MFFVNIKFLTAQGLQAHFVKIKQSEKNVNGAAATARFRQNFERHSHHKRFSKLEKNWKNGFALCVSPYRIYDIPETKC